MHLSYISSPNFTCLAESMDGTWSCWRFAWATWRFMPFLCILRRKIWVGVTTFLTTFAPFSSWRFALLSHCPNGSDHIPATERRGVHGIPVFKECRKANGIERKRLKTIQNRCKKVLPALWEQDAGSSSLPTRTKIPLKSMILEEFFFVYCMAEINMSNQ